MATIVDGCVFDARAQRHFESSSSTWCFHQCQQSSNSCATTVAAVEHKLHIHTSIRDYVLLLHNWEREAAIAVSTVSASIK
eukprot:20003-Heterococcus_DN1.PRE.4